ncbi:MAG: hypothetical protein WKF30_07250 [Pyrinomonadaceae bacterium]
MQNPQGFGSASPPPPPYGAPSGPSSTGLQPNVAALLAYVLTWLTGLVFFLIEKQSPFVRFHAMQSILLGVAVIVFQIGLTIVSVILSQIIGVLGSLVGLLGFVVLLGFLVIWVLCMVKSYQGQMFKLPIIGDMAEKFAAK